MNIEELSVADGKIEWVRTSLEIAEVGFVNWEEKRLTITFNDVLAVENLNIEGEELDRLAVDTMSSDFVARARGLVDEPDGELHCYEFFVPWKDEPRLRILAASIATQSG